MKSSDLSDKSVNINPEDMLKYNSSNFFIPYSEIQEIIIRKGTDTVVTNMLGSMITTNFLTIRTSKKGYYYRIPVNKNGTFEEVQYWLSTVIPVKVFSY